MVFILLHKTADVWIFSRGLADLVVIKKIYGGWGVKIDGVLVYFDTLLDALLTFSMQFSERITQ